MDPASAPWFPACTAKELFPTTGSAPLSTASRMTHSVFPKELSTISAVVFQICVKESENIGSNLQSSPVLCTDAPRMICDGKRTYIGNFSNDTSVLYVAMPTKKRSQMEKIELLKGFSGILEHDHETALYDEILALGEKEAEVTRGRYNRQEKRRLLNRLKKHKENHLLFLQ